MNQINPRTSFTAKLVAGLVAMSVPVLLSAQVSLYQFSESSGTYTPLTAADGGVTLGTPTYWPQANNNRAWVNNPFNDPAGQVTMNGYLTPAEGPGYPIGFDFTFNGDVFDVIGISNGGWISFGKSTDGLQAVWVYNYDPYSNGDPFLQWYNGPTPDYKRNRVAGFGNTGLQQVDWSSVAPPGPVSSIRMATIGTAPNRVCVIQWTGYGLDGDVTVGQNLINFQIRLNEVDNSVEVQFGPMSWDHLLGRRTTTQIGLAGRNNQDYNGRMTVYEQPSFIYDWTNTVPADTNLAYCTMASPQPGMPNGSGILPVEGTIWRWDPPVCPPPTWPLTITDISFDYANVQWEPSAAGEYEYYVSTADSVTGPEVTSGTTTDTELALFGLEANTTYYVFIRSICDGEPGVWGPATPFTTIGGGMVVCDGTGIDLTYCSQQNDSVTWQYISADGSPLSIELYDGFCGSVAGESFTIWDGQANSGTLLYDAPAGSNVGGQAFTASSGVITVVLVTGAGACEAQPWYLPYQWRVGCKNCTDPLASYSVTDDCDNHQYYVDVNIFNLGSSSTVYLENSLGLPPDTVTTTGVHTVGPFPSGQPVVITIQNADNVMCHTSSAEQIGSPCTIQDCGPTTYTYCYTNDEHHQWAYQGEGDQEIGVRFKRGTVGLGDDLVYYNGLDLMEALPVSSYLTNVLLTSSAPSTDHAVVMDLTADNSVSCAIPDTLFGGSEEWEYVVACYDGCTQPHATATTHCISQTQYEVYVVISEIGSAGSATITNSLGAPAVTAADTGTYTVGPFSINSPVDIEVEGASVLCSWTLHVSAPDCSNVGITEQEFGRLGVFPNPSDGSFSVQFPEGLKGTTELRVTDLAGRTVYQEAVRLETVAQLNLGNLPNGLYTLTAQSPGGRLISTISILH